MKIIVLLFFISVNLFSQYDISGLWVAYIDKNPFYTLMYIDLDEKSTIEGLIFDEDDHDGFCNYFVKGKYNSAQSILSIDNSELIDKSPNHFGGKYELVYSRKGDKEYLEGKFFIYSPPLPILKNYEFINKILQSTPMASKIIFERPIENKLKDIPNIDKIISSSVDEKMLSKNQFIPRTRPSKIVKNETKEVNEKEFIEVKKKRTDLILGTIETKSSELLLKVRDYGIQDGDRISIYLDDTVIRYNIPIQSKVENIIIPLPKDKQEHKLYFVANNVGTAPPNTAQISLVIDGNKIDRTVFTDEKQNNYFLIKTN